MILEKPTYQYLTNETQRYTSSGKCDDLKSALAELERIAYANTLVLAEELFRKVVMPFCVEHRYTFAVIRGEARLTPIDEEVPQAQLILDQISVPTSYAEAPMLFMLMPNFDLTLQNTPIIVKGEDGEATLLKFELFEHPDPHGWLGGFAISRNGNNTKDGTLRPNEFTLA